MTLVDVRRKFPAESDCVRHIEALRWGKGKPPICPKCGHTCTPTRRPDGRFNCHKCHFTYRGIHGTVFHGTHIPLQKWFLLITLMLNAKKGVSSCQLARDCEVTQPTAWYMAMRVRAAMVEQGELLKGIIEIDETYVGGRPRGTNDRTPTAGPKWSTKTPVVGMMERGGRVKAAPIEAVRNAAGASRRRR